MKLANYLGSQSTIYIALLLVFISIHHSTVQAGTSNHRYKKGEHVELWVNKVTTLVTAVNTRLVIGWSNSIRLVAITRFSSAVFFLPSSNTPHTHIYLRRSLGWSVRESTGSIRVLYTPLLRSRNEAPSQGRGYHESI
jgi:hypothetical protein